MQTVAFSEFPKIRKCIFFTSIRFIQIFHFMKNRQEEMPFHAKNSGNDFVAGFLHDQDKKRVDFINFSMNENP